MSIKEQMLEKQRDIWAQRCIVLENENSKLRKLLELHGIDYPKEKPWQNE